MAAKSSISPRMYTASHLHNSFSRFRASSSSSSSSSSQSVNSKRNVYKELGLFSLRKKIEDAVLRAEMSGPTALELEEARRIRQEELISENNLWEDHAESDEILHELAGSTKVVDALKDLRYKAEEARLITELVEMDAINSGLFKQAYNASVDVSKFLDQYEMTKLLRGQYDAEGACLVIEAGPKGVSDEIWAELLLSMYTKWAEKQGYKGRVVEKCCAVNGGIRSATIEFEFQYAYGFLLGERGIHRLKRSSSVASIHHEASKAGVDVIPLFLEAIPDVQIVEEDLKISSLTTGEEKKQKTGVCIHHIPTGISVESYGERSHFANKMKALNRLKAKLLVIAKAQDVQDVRSIQTDAIVDTFDQETRRYVIHPYKMVQDVKTGIHLPDTNSILEGNIEPLIAAHVGIRQIHI